ncbi:MAG: 1-acyl-sn-glycerol-3-phosphate acyltransferase [Planctomycetes bacterium]|nr:1-acyl-sn-glycerol-3-phosphate acyltransferase [Planctomycetota bacterium]
MVAMFRAILVAVVSMTIVSTLCTLLAIAGLIYPSRRFCDFVSYVWSHYTLIVAGVRLSIEGSEHLAGGGPFFFVGNHQSALDIAIICEATRGDVRFLAKSSLFRIPVFGWDLRRYGYIPIDRKHPRETHRALTRMLSRMGRNPVSLVMFPEGTRSPDGEMLPFRQGAMKICQRAGLPIVPFSIQGTRAVLRRGVYKIRPGSVRLVFGKAIPADEVEAMTARALADRLWREVANGLGDPRTPKEEAPPSLATAER